jgi:hypothetical protein
MKEEDFKYTGKLADAMDALWKYSPSDEALQNAKTELGNSVALEFSLTLLQGTYSIGDKDSKGITESVQGMLQAIKEPNEKIFKPIYQYFQDTWKSISTFVKANPKENIKKKDFIMKKCKVLLEKAKLEAKTVAVKVGKMAAMAGLSVGLMLTAMAEGLKLGVNNAIKAASQAVTLRNKAGGSRDL